MYDINSSYVVAAALISREPNKIRQGVSHVTLLFRTFHDQVPRPEASRAARRCCALVGTSRSALAMSVPRGPEWSWKGILRPMINTADGTWPQHTIRPAWKQRAELGSYRIRFDAIGSSYPRI